MNESSQESGQEDTAQELMATVDERLDVEAIAHAVEHLQFNTNLSKKIQGALQSVRWTLNSVAGELGGTQRELRDLILDVALLKRAAASLGQVGVLERRRIERELILELFPPACVRSGIGVRVNPSSAAATAQVDCESQRPVCKGICCRLFDIPLTPPEVESNEYDWDPKRPYMLHKRPSGCAHLREGDCRCSIYDSRPAVCRGYSCEKDSRIWLDFEKKILRPELKKRLEALEGRPGEASQPVAPAAAEVSSSEGNRQHSPAPRAGGAQGDESTASESDVGKSGASGGDPLSLAEPPDFSELREMIVPQPTDVFVPPEPDAAPKSEGDSEEGSPEQADAKHDQP